MTGRCFGIDWEPVSDISSFYQLPVPAFREVIGLNEYTILPELAGESALLRSLSEDVREMERWRDSDVVYYMSNEISWEKTTKLAEFVSSEFSSLASLNSYDLAHIVTRLLFSMRTDLLSHEFKDVFSQFCESDVVIGVQMRLSEGRYQMEKDVLVDQCFIPEMARRCFEFMEKNQKTSCVFFITSDLSVFEASELLDELREKLGSAFKNLFPSHQVSYRLFSSPVVTSHVDHFNFLYSLFGIWDIRDYMGTFLDWELLKSVDVLLMSQSGFPQTAFWFSGAPAFILNTFGSECKFLRATKDGAFAVNTTKDAIVSL
jgi:hypothetical protein